MTNKSLNIKATIISLLSITLVSSTACISTIGSNNNKNSLSVNIDTYLKDNKNINKEFLSYHDYNSIEESYQSYYIVDVNKENVQDPK
ncbi:MAG: hypothetical protein HUJ68_08540 [Clostridia bacterium]|nr:hypothetical protein [Clostridia bacterium]